MVEFSQIVVVGLGGIGSLLVEPLCRYLSGYEDHLPITLVDGDRYSRENFSRQKMTGDDIGINKAEAQTEKLRNIFPELSFTAKPFYIEQKNISEIITDGSMILSCVDNHATRKLLSDALKRLRNGVLISGGNEYTDGNVQVFARVNGRNKTPPIDQYHDEIKYPVDRNPATMSCEEIAELGADGQIIFTNLMAASLMLNAFYSTLLGKFDVAEIYFDIKTNKSNPRRR